MRRRKLSCAFSILAVVSTLFVVGATSGLNPASAWVGPSSNTTAAVPMDCVATAPLVGEVPASQDITLVTGAPNKAEVGEQFDIFSQASASTAPTNVSGYNINTLRQFEVRIPLPAGATRVNEQIVPATGSGYGSAGITWDAGNSRWVFTVSGPIAGGANFQFPQIRIRVQASGAPGSTIQPRLGGNSKTNYGFSLIVNADLPQPIGTSDIPTACWPKQPNPAFSSTQIIPIDNAGPGITIAAPANAGTYALNSVVNANYNCNDGVNGTGGATCVGTVASLSPFNTTSVGPKSFTVNASDNKGNTSTQTVNYTVVDQPAISVQPTWSFEGAPASFSLVLSKPWPLPITVHYQTANGTAIAGNDYTGVSNNANFAANQLAVPISVTTANDAAYEGERQFTLNLSSPTNALLADTSAVARILDDETPPPSALGKTVTEGPGVTVDFDVSIPFNPGVPVSVSYQTANGDAIVGNDYQNTFGLLTFNPGDSLTQTVSVPVIDDGQDDGYAIDFSLLVTNVGTGEAGQAGLAVILDNDGPPPTAAPIGAKLGDNLVVEGDNTTRNAWVMVRLDKPVTATVSFNYTTADGSATAVSKDYKAESGTLTFQPGQTTRAISLGILPDTLNEGDEQFYVNLTFVGGGNPIGDAQGVVTIQDDDNPTASGYVVSVGDAQMWEGNADLGQVDLPLTINKKRPKDAPDEDVEVQIDIAYGTATATDVYVKDLSDTVMFPGGVNKNVQLKVRGDTAVEPDEELTVTASATGNTPGSVSFGRPVGTLTIRNDDGPPTAPVSVRADTSTTKLGYVDLSWGAPLSGEPPTAYEWRVATDGTLDTEPWASTNTGLNRNLEHDCGEGATCLYQLRATNFAGTSPGSAIVPGTGLEDLVAPDLTVFTPKSGANVEDYAMVAYNGLIGTAMGDARAATVNVYACANCTSIAPTQTMAASISGAGWSALGAALPAGVYTVEVVQTDWAGNTTSVQRGMQTRNAVFVSATGSDANPGTAAFPKSTILAGLNTAVSAGRAEVAVGQGTYGALSLTAAQSGKLVNGGFDQYAGWSRPGTAGVPGTASQDLTSIEAGPTAVLLNGTTALVLNGLRIKGSNAGQPAGTTIYGLRAIGSSTVDLRNVKVLADNGVDGTAGANGTDGATGGVGLEGPIGGETCSGNHLGGLGGTGGANSGGRGGTARCNNSGLVGTAGTGPGGAGGSGGARLQAGFLDPTCGNGGPGGGGGAGAGGAASGTVGAAGTGGTAGATWLGNNGTSGGGGTAGLGGGGGGGGGGTDNGFYGTCSGADWGGAGGGGGAGAAAGTGGALGTAGGGSFGVYAQNSTVTADALTSITSGPGGNGGAGGNAGSGGSGGGGGRGGSVTNSGNSGAPTGNQSPFPCGLFFPACYADGGPGAGGGGGGAGAGGNGGGGGAGGPSSAVLHTGTGTVTIAAATSAAAGGAGGAGGTAGANGLRGESGAAAAGAWSAAPNAGAQGGAVAGSTAAGGNGGAGFTCRIHDGGSCLLP